MRALFFAALVLLAVPAAAGTYPGRPPTTDRWGPTSLPTAPNANHHRRAPTEATLPSDGATVPPRLGPLTTPPPGWTFPRPLNSHAVTGADYPPASIVAGEQGRTLVKYLVGTDGTVSGIVIQTSSGYPRLDEASQAIVKRWFFAPATHDGKPAPMWQAAVVVWQLHDSFDIAVETPDKPFAIIEPERSDYPLESIAAHEQGMSVIMVFIAKDGTVGSVVVCRPSGYPRLDQAAMTLVLGKWHPKPAVLNGKPVQTVLMLAVRWRL